MSRLAKSVQYPIPCPKCEANTAHSLEKLVDVNEVTCRHCGNEFEISDLLKRRASRTLNDLTGYIDMPEEAETAADDIRDETPEAKEAGLPA